jgi:pyruvate dehydrogenase complex dehydrogenase (E1) component
LAAEGAIPVKSVEEAVQQYRIDPDSADPWSY